MIGQSVHRLRSVESTNDTAFELARKGAKDGEVVIADVQTKGRGRSGRVWESPANRNIYMSVILRPRDANDIASITLVAGIAVAEALKRYAKGELKIKWPNDIWLNGKKLCGILTERGDGFIIIGIGINVNAGPEDFSEDVRKIATSLFIDSGRELNIEEVFERICRKLNDAFIRFSAGGFGSFKDIYSSWSLIDGKRVRVTFGGEITTGIALGVDSDGALLLSANGETRRIIAGDVDLCS